MSRYEALFAQPRRDGVLIPFLMLGDPSAAGTMAAVAALVAGGADALELGIPYSDPVADGPVIQRSAGRARAAGMTPSACFDLVSAIRAAHPALPIGLLVYANLVVRRGIADFYHAAATAGADSVLVPDVPGIEAQPFVSAARAAGVQPVFVIPPAARSGTIAQVAEMGGGFTYVQGRPGVTGAAIPMSVPDRELLQALAAAGAPPPMVGFGVSQRCHLDAALDAGARGVLVGSAVVQILEQLAGDPGRTRAELIGLLERIRPRPSSSDPVTRSTSVAQTV